MVRIVLVLVAVGLTGLIQIPPLLGRTTRRELWVVVFLLAASLALGLLIVGRPEGPSMGLVLGLWLEPVGTFLFGPR